MGPPRGCIFVLIKLIIEGTTMIGLLTLLGIFAASAGAAQAQFTSGTGSNPSSHTTSGYTRSTGTYVQPYTATNPNGTQRDNYGSSGNVNPYTGATGHRTPRY